ncbi:MAG: c-type cytochrome [Opitutaceae bacterium]|nr:c-type cytochrome [Opitutaceae bacterium]
MVVTLTLIASAQPLPEKGGGSRSELGKRDARAHPTDLWGDWIEKDFPFFSSVLDARKTGGEFPTDNLVPRGLVFQLGRDCWACFDTDLLRIAAVWQGREGVTPHALAPGSYHDPSRKTPGGQSFLPEPSGRVWVATGIYPGWQMAGLSLKDPRTPAPSPEEVGRGPLPGKLGRLNWVRPVANAAVLGYSVGESNIEEWIDATGTDTAPVVRRHFLVGPAQEQRVLVLGRKSADVHFSIECENAKSRPVLSSETAADGSVTWLVRIEPHADPLAFSVSMTLGAAPQSDLAQIAPPPAVHHRWPQTVSSEVHRSTSLASYVVDDIDLPVANPWRRNIRISDIQFLPDGTGVGVTIDGDVWLLRGLEGSRVEWRRFASGLHEPMTAAIRNGEIYVFDRNGIWRLPDRDGDGEADEHELFSNAFGQTADTREFPATLRLAPHGEFVIAKGGQQATTVGKHNGSVLRISADGRTATVLGYGFRQPNIGVNIRTGLVTSSDQQGQYIPSTPLHIADGDQFYGFLSDFMPREKYPAPIADPLVWLPHSVNASGISQVWLFNAKMGALNDGLVHIGFNRPELFSVLLNSRERRMQAAVTSVTQDFEFPPLNGSVNPIDGQLYLAGFQVLGWGTTATRLAGLARVRYTGHASALPREVVPMKEGVLLRFGVRLDPVEAVKPANYSVSTWHYIRTYRYGSPQLRADGKPGADPLPASSVYLSEDGCGVFIGIPGMQPVMQLRVGWSLKTRDGEGMVSSAYTTPYLLPHFEPRVEGFGDIRVDLSNVVAATAKEKVPATKEEGATLARTFGCVACHGGVEGSPAIATYGPSWAGLYGKTRDFGGKVGRIVADDAYLRESILDPQAKIVPGTEKVEAGMPSYAGVLSDDQMDAIIAYIKSLK